MRFLTPAFVTVAMLVVVGLLVGGYFVKSMLARDEKPPEALTRNVPMAVADIPAGTLITEAHLGQGPMLVEKLNEQRDILLANRVIVNRIAKETIKAASPIRSTQLWAPGEFPSLEVAEGMRAVSLLVGESTNLVSGLIKPGQYVDVHLTPNNLPNDERTGGGFTMTLFKGVKVLAVNRGQQTPGAVDRTGNQVTLELTPRQSNIIIQAKQRGVLTLTYNPEGKGSGGVAGGTDDRATFDEILGLQPPPQPEPPFIIENYAGSGRSLVSFIDGKHADLYYATYGRRGAYGYGYGAGNGTWGSFDFHGMRPPPVNNWGYRYWNQSGPTDAGATNVPYVPPAPAAGNGPAPSGMPPMPSYPSAQNPLNRASLPPRT